MEIKLADRDSAVVLSETIFATPYNEALVHQAVVAYLAGARQGSRKHKTRSEVSGGGRKPFRQKGTGRARAGTTRSPIWRSGGVTFAARPQDHSQKLNRKMYRGAMRSIMAELMRTDRLVIVEDFSIEAPKTRQMVQKLEELDLESALIVLEGFDEKIYLAARNLKDVDVLSIEGMNPVSLMAFDKVVLTAVALKKLEVWLS